MSKEIQETLIHHWAMDVQAAETLSEVLYEYEADRIVEQVDDLPAGAIALRDGARESIGLINQGKSDKFLIGMGSCSLDPDTDYEPFFDMVTELQDRHADTIVAFRGNGAKPRSGGAELSRGGDWTGMHHSTDPYERQKLLDIYMEAMERGIPILTEVTGNNQVGSYAPYLSGIWLGARDMPSTSLRTMASAIHLPVSVKNGLDGKVDTVERSMLAIGRSSADNSDSGVDLGTIASSPSFRGVPTGILPVGEGNQKIGIIARGHELAPGMVREERREAAIRHISELCLLAARQDSSVMIDGSHGVPPMFDIDRKDGDRFPRVMKEIFQAISQGEIEHPDMISGLMFEIGPNVGRTDPNWIVTEKTVDELSEIIESLPRPAAA